MANENEFKVVFDGDASPIEVAAKRATKALEGIKPGAAQAGGALISLSRVVQDAPFGFIAIQNNITELIPAFGRLSAASGGPIGALKALGGALIGPAGIGFAVSAVTSLITAGIQKYGSLGTAFAALTGDITAAAAAQRKFTTAIADAGGSVAGEVEDIRSLVRIATDENQARQARQQAIDKLNASYPLFHKNLTIENANSKELKATIDAITDSLVRQAKIKGITDLISQEQSKIAKLQANPDEALGFLDFLGTAIKGTYQNVGTRAVGLFNTATKAANAEVGKTEKGIEALRKQLDALNTDQAKSGTLFVPPDTKAKLAADTKGLGYYFALVEREQERGYAKMDADANKEIDSYFNNIAKGLSNQARLQKVQDALNHVNFAIRQGAVTGPKNPDAGPALPLDQNIEAADKLSQIYNKFRELGKKPPDVSWLSSASAKALLLSENLTEVTRRAAVMGSIVTEFAQPAFDTLFSSLISGSQSAGQAITSFFKNLVTQLLTTIATAAALSAILSAFGFAGPGGATGFGNIFKSLLGGGGGGFGSSGNGLSFAGGGLEVVGKLSGKDIALSLQRTTNSNGRTGG